MMSYTYNEDLSPEENTACALYGIAYQLMQLGNAGAATPMGALEALGLVFKEGFELLASSIGELAQAVDRHGET